MNTPRSDPDSGVELVAVHDDERFIGVLFKPSVHRLGVSAIRELIGKAQSQLPDRGLRRSQFVEIKHWVSGRSVGSWHVRKPVSVVLNERQASGLCWSTSGFAGNAFESPSQSELKHLRIAGQEKMVAICETYLKAESSL